MNTAFLSPDHLTVLRRLDSDTVAVSVPNGFDDVRQLQNRVATVSDDNRRYGFRGWNSDANEAYFSACSTILGFTFPRNPTVRRARFNQPSTNQPLHRLHGANVYLFDEFTGARLVRCFPLDGSLDFPADPRCFSDGWR